MGKIWNLEDHKGKTAVIDEFGNQVTYDVLNSEACVLSNIIGHRCLVFFCVGTRLVLYWDIQLSSIMELSRSWLIVIWRRCYWKTC